MVQKAKFSPKSDLNAAFVVFLVSMPLCLGIAAASGAPIIAGIIGGGIGGIVVGFLGGSPLLVTGPANGLLVVSWELINQHGFALFLWAVFLAGLLQILAGILKLGQFFRAVTPGVILGLMTGFAVVILSSQLLALSGLKTTGSVFNNFQSFFENLISFSSKGVDMTFALGVFSLLLLSAYDKFLPKKLKIIPAALFGMIIATSLCFYLGLDVNKITLPTELFASAERLNFNLWESITNSAVINAALLIAFIASAETLLSATAVDKLHTGERTHYNRELTAQGIGNALCGIFGGIPVTGVILRSTANVAAGAKSKWANIFSGVLLIGFVVIFPGLLSQIPLTVLAAVLIHSVVKLIRIEDIKHLWEYDRFAILVYAATALGIVFMGVLVGVAAGLILSILHSIQSLSRTMVGVTIENDKTILRLEGAATFFRIPQIASVLEEIDAGTQVIIDHENLVMIDFAVYTMLQEWEDQHKALGGSVSPKIGDMIMQLPYVAMRAPQAKP